MPVAVLCGTHGDDELTHPEEDVDRDKGGEPRHAGALSHSTLANDGRAFLLTVAHQGLLLERFWCQHLP